MPQSTLQTLISILTTAALLAERTDLLERIDRIPALSLSAGLGTMLFFTEVLAPTARSPQSSSARRRQTNDRSPVPGVRLRPE